MIRNVGELEIEGADDANVPVDIWVHQISDEWTKPHNGYGYVAEPGDVGKYILIAGNYMPRKARVAGLAYTVIVDTLDELKDVIEKHIIPLYEIALAVLKKMAGGNLEANLYYWDDD